MVLPVRIRIHWGSGRFCFCFFPKIFLTLKVLLDGCVRKTQSFRQFTRVRAPSLCFRVCPMHAFHAPHARVRPSRTRDARTNVTKPHSHTIRTRARRETTRARRSSLRNARSRASRSIQPRVRARARIRPAPRARPTAPRSARAERTRARASLTLSREHTYHVASTCVAKRRTFRRRRRIRRLAGPPSGGTLDQS